VREEARIAADASILYRERNMSGRVEMKGILRGILCVWLALVVLGMMARAQGTIEAVPQSQEGFGRWIRLRRRG